MKFYISDKNEKIPNGFICLHIDKWNDYSFVTMFYLTYYDESGNAHDIGNVKIGFQNQTTEFATYLEIPKVLGSRIFERLPGNFFSLGTDVEYYKNLCKLPNEVKFFILDNLNDVARKIELFDKFEKEQVMQDSLLRGGKRNHYQRTICKNFKRRIRINQFSFLF